MPVTLLGQALLYTAFKAEAAGPLEKDQVTALQRAVAARRAQQWRRSQVALSTSPSIGSAMAAQRTAATITVTIS